MNIDLNKVGGKLAYVFFTTIGAGLASYNLLAFKAGSGVIYYADVNQAWATVGALCLLVGYFIRNWKKL
ncbi:MAG: hypothetical protein OEZ10_11405 [Gammaproteobacteria bacterium]|nr:hypothetical protein [Gammaproteobacteria bacterium]